TRGCNPAYSKSIHTWLRFGEIMRGSLRATRQRLQDAVEGKGEVSTADVKELLLATRYLMLTTDGE
ncbi:TPA_asm: hypothetical protein G1U98_24985, partial [Salmonella enterica subsp. enterica serovar Typhi str. CT18]|nr:hypothetical protein [Salmonella enterica subsp. enterica serovar Typhi str. CT18]